MDSFPELDRAAPSTLTQQIADFFVEAIDTGRLRPGDRLPTIRELAQNCSVTRTTAQDAYRHLSERGLVEGTVGRGTTVLGEVPAAGERDSVGDGPSCRPLSSFAEAALRRTREMLGAPSLADGQQLVANFAELAPDSDRFPVDEWLGST